MKKNIIFICMLLALCSGHITYAEEEIPKTPTRQNILLERIGKQKENYTQNLQEARKIAEEYREATSPEQKENLRMQARHGFMVRLTNATDKLGELQKKIDDRIVLAKEKGLSVEEAETKLKLSKDHLNLVIEEQKKLETKLNGETISKEEVKESFDLIKENLSKARAALIESMQILKKVVVDSIENKEGKEVDEDDEETTNEEN